MLTDSDAYNLIPAKCVTREPSNKAIKPLIYILGLSEVKFLFPLRVGIEKRDLIIGREDIRAL